MSNGNFLLNKNEKTKTENKKINVQNNIRNTSKSKYTFQTMYLEWTHVKKYQMPFNEVKF